MLSTRQELLGDRFIDGFCCWYTRGIAHWLQQFQCCCCCCFSFVVVVVIVPCHCWGLKVCEFMFCVKWRNRKSNWCRCAHTISNTNNHIFIIAVVIWYWRERVFTGARCFSPTIHRLAVPQPLSQSNGNLFVFCYLLMFLSYSFCSVLLSSTIIPIQCDVVNF